jgi:protein gp37
MADKTGIEWTDATWNPIRGCSMARGSELGGCLNCYAARVAVRYSGAGMPYDGLARMTDNGPRWTGKVQVLDDDHLTQPLRWKKPRRIFVNSMSDLFHESLTFDAIDRIVAVMAAAKQHTFQVLTKRADRMAEYLTHPSRRTSVLYAGKALDLGNPATSSSWWPLPNVWWGVSAEDQKTLDDRMPFVIRALPDIAVAWLSAEPLLGPMDLAKWLPHTRETSQTSEHFYPGLHWVVAGGESGPDARPMHPAWPTHLALQCTVAGVPFLFKQWGEWTPDDNGTKVHRVVPTHHRNVIDTLAVRMFRAGKKAAGRLLNGREWNDYPAMAERTGR